MLKRLARLVLQRHFHHKRGKQSGSPMRGKDVFWLWLCMLKLTWTVNWNQNRFLYNGQEKKIPMRKCSSLPACCWSSSATAAYFKASTQHLPDLGEENLLLLLEVKFFFSDAKCSKSKRNNNNKKMYMLPSKSNIMVKSLGLFKMLRYLGFLGEKVDTQKGNYLEKKNQP